MLAARGIHDPATMPFTEPWNRRRVTAAGTQYRAILLAVPSRGHARALDIPLAVMADGRPVGVCTVHAEDFPSTAR